MATKAAFNWSKYIKKYVSHLYQLEFKQSSIELATIVGKQCFWEMHSSLVLVSINSPSEKFWTVGPF